MQIIATAIIKGGTGKTTTAAAIAQAARADGRRVLCVDLDPQGDLTYAIGADGNRPGAYAFIAEEAGAAAVQHTAQGIDAIAGAPDLATLRTGTGSAQRLRAALGAFRGRYDLIIIDTPPQLGELTYNALQAATGLIMPVECDSAAINGLYQIAGTAEQIRRYNAGLTLTGVIITRYDPRPKINRQYKEMIAAAAQRIAAPYLGEIRAGIAAREAAALQLSLYEYAPKSKPAQDYKRIYDQIKGE